MKNGVLWVVFAVLVGMSACFISCKGREDKVKTKSEEIEFVDYYNRKHIISPNPQRVVSLSPGITELLFDLGVGDRIVGRTDFCLYPQNAKNIPSVGGISDANLELIVAKQPDIIFAASMVSRQMVERLEDLGFRVVCLPERKKIGQVYETVGLLGEIFQKKELADSLIENMKAQIECSKTLIPKGNRPTVYYVVGFGDSGDFTCGGDTFIDEIISLAGGENIAKQIKGWSIGKEEIFARQPQYIIIRKQDAERFVATAPYNRLEAVKEGRVLGIESSIMDCQSLRTPQAVEQIREFLFSKAE